MVGQPRHKFHAPMLINDAADETALTQLADTKIYSPQRNKNHTSRHLRNKCVYCINACQKQHNIVTLQRRSVNVVVASSPKYMWGNGVLYQVKMPSCENQHLPTLNVTNFTVRKYRTCISASTRIKMSCLPS